MYNVAFAQKENTKKIKETPYEKVTDLKKLETATKDAYFSEGFEVEFPPVGWVLSPNAGDDWAQDNGTDFGPGAPYEGELCIFFNDYDYTAGTTASITTPGIDLSAATAPRLAFMYWDTGDDDVVQVNLSTDGTSFNSFYTTDAAVTTWTELVLDLTDYAGSTVYIQFVGTSVYGYSNPHIDNIVVEETPEEPIAELNYDVWEAGDVMLGNTAMTAGFVLKNAGVGLITVSAITDLSATEFSTDFSLDSISPGLGAQESYAFGFNYVPNEIGVDAVDFVITTNMGDLTVSLNGEGIPVADITFEDGMFPDGMIIIDNDADGQPWEVVELDPHNGAFHASVTYNGAGCDDWMILPKLTPAADNGYLSFYAKSYSASYLETFKVMLSTTGNALEDFTVELGEHASVPSAWAYYTFDLTDYNDTEVYVAIVCVSVNMSRLYIDDIYAPVIYPENELAATDIMGEYAVANGVDAAYEVTVMNKGVETQTDYTVKLMEGDVELASIAGVELEFGASSVFNFTYAFTTNGETAVYGKVVLTGDENADNDMTSDLSILVRPLITISGDVVTSDSPTIGLENANVTISVGDDVFEDSTDANGDFVFVDAWGIDTYAIMISAEGYNTYEGEFTVADVDFMVPTITIDESAYPAEDVTAELIDEEVLVEWSEPIENSSTSKAFESYNVYRLIEGEEATPENWVSLATEITALTYTDATVLEQGVYKYAVEANYTNSVVSSASLSDIVIIFTGGEVTVNVTTNGGDAEGAVVILANQDGDESHIYELIAPVGGEVVFDEVWMGTYDMMITLNGFEDYIVYDTYISENDETIAAQLIESIIDPTTPEIEVVENTAHFLWNVIVGGETFSENFDETFPPEGWTIVDEDGDGNNWHQFEFSPYGGDGFSAASTSFTTSALTPDNWLITPAIGLRLEPELTFQVAAQSPNWFGDRYNVLISTASSSIADFEDILYTNVTNSTEYQEVSIDLSDYAGQTVYLAWQHTDCTNMFTVKIDEVEITDVQANSKEFINYEVYLDNTVVATVSETEYKFTDLAYETSFTAGVAAIYTSGESEIITIDFETPVGIILSDENDISAFSVPGQIGNEVIGNHTIAIVVPEGTDLSASVATFSISSEATIVIGDIEQVSGTTANDFTSSVTYIVTAENGDEQAWVVTITPNTSVNDIALDEYFTVYPNPTKNKLNVSSYYSIDKVEIYSAIGNLLITNEKYVDGINVSELSEGVYFVRITSENNIITKRVFISK